MRPGSWVASLTRRCDRRDMRTRRDRLSRLIGIVAIGTLAYSSGCAQPARDTTVTALVTKVTLQSDSLPQATVCPATLRFRGTVVAATPGVVRYRFRLDVGTPGPYVEMPMKDKEARDVVYLFHAGSAGSRAARGTLQFEVRGSRGVQRARSSFVVTCAGQAGPSVEEENPLASFRAKYLGPRDNSLDVAGERRLRDYERLRAMRRRSGQASPPFSTVTGCGRCRSVCVVFYWSDQHRRASDEYRDRSHEQPAAARRKRRRRLAIHRRSASMAASL